LEAKEGLAMINGTQFICTYGSLAGHAAELLMKQADVVACLTLEVLYGCRDFADPKVHQARPHPQQMAVAERIRKLLEGKSTLYDSPAAQKARAKKVQDAYSLRCIPQIHGPSHALIEQATKILSTEINSATDNPMVFSTEEQMLSAGNFHGEFPAKACDLLSLAATELSNVSERRLERLLNPDTERNSDLPFFLIPPEKGGLHSGMMITQYTAAALTAENRSRTTNGSKETIPTCGNKEDHVSMGGHAALNAWQVVRNTASVLAIELIAACQGLEYRRPLKTTPALEAVYQLVRTKVPAVQDDCTWNEHFATVTDMLMKGQVWNAVATYVSNTTKDIDLRIPKGMRDFGPDQMVVRQQVMDTVVAIYKKHGAVTIATPVMGHKSILTGRW
jgi:histidine ammonia-lyase